MLEAAIHTPKRTALLLLLGLVLSIASGILGDRAFDDGWAGAAWIAWPSGTLPFFAAGTVLWALLLVPSGRIEQGWSERVAKILLVGAALGIVVQLLDDHVFNHAGTDNPLGFSIPYPFQDLLTFAALILVAAALVGTLITTTGRLIRRRHHI